MKENNVTKQDSDIIKWLRFPLIIAIIFVHNFNNSNYSNNIYWNDFFNDNIIDIISIIFSQLITKLAVPVFFIISGYLFFINIKKWNKIIYKTKIRSRIKTLFIPYIIWNAISLGVVIIIKISNYLINKQSLSSIVLYIKEKGGLLNIFWGYKSVSINKYYNLFGIDITPSYPMNYPLWFIRDLMILIIITPLIYYLIKKLKFSLIIILSLLYITDILPYIPGLSTTAILFFSIGAYYGINKKSFTNELMKLKNTSFIFTILLLFPVIIYHESNSFIKPLIYHLFIIIKAIAFINISVLLYQRSKHLPSFSTITKSTFFIYVVHTILIIKISNYVVNIFLSQNNSLTTSLYYIFTSLLTASICIILYFSLNRYLPKTMKLITGGR